MKARKVILVLCAILLVALSFVSCKKKQETTVYYHSATSRVSLSSSTKISLNGYSFDSFLSNGMIKISEKRGSLTYYGVLTDHGDSVLPVEYVSLVASGNFFAAEGESKHYVFSKNGQELASFDEEIEVSDVGMGYFSVKTKSGAYLYNAEGKNMLPGTLLDPSYRFSVCGNFAMARSSEKGGTFLFHLRTSDTFQSFLDTSERNYLVAYMGGNDFIVVTTDRLASADGCDVEITRDGSPVYYKQTVRRYTFGISDPTVLSPGRFIVKINNRYTVGLTEEDRENFGLLDGYSAVSYYVTEGRKASGALNHYVTDATLKEIKAMPEGVSALLTPVDGIAAALTDAGAILFLNESAEVVGRIDDAVYQNVFFSGEVVTASKVTDSGVVRLGAFDSKGKVVLPFEYSYISAFVGGKAVASKGGKAYVVTTSGAESYVGDYPMPHYFDGFYQTTSGDKVGATSFDGTVLIPAEYASFAAVLRYKNTVLAAVTLDTVTDVYRFN